MTQPTPALTPVGGSRNWVIGLGIFVGAMVLGPCCLLGAMGGFIARQDPGAGAVLGGSGLVFGLLFGAMFGGIFAFVAWRRSNLEGIVHLHALQQAWGGVVHKPGLVRPMLQPCWIGEVEGVPVRVSLYMMQRGGGGVGSLVRYAAVSAMNASQDWKLPAGSHVRLSIRVAAPAGVRFVGVCRNSIAGATAGLSSMQPVMAGDPGFDGNFMCFCEDVGQGEALVAQERGRLNNLLGFNVPWISRLELSRDGADWLGPYSEHTGLQAIQGIVGDLMVLGRWGR